MKTTPDNPPVEKPLAWTSESVCWLSIDLS
jgi:hypothetical protein